MVQVPEALSPARVIKETNARAPVRIRAANGRQQCSNHAIRTSWRNKPQRKMPRAATGRQRWLAGSTRQSTECGIGAKTKVAAALLAWRWVRWATGARGRQPVYMVACGNNIRRRTRGNTRAGTRAGRARVAEGGAYGSAGGINRRQVVGMREGGRGYNSNVVGGTRARHRRWAAARQCRGVERHAGRTASPARSSRQQEPRTSVADVGRERKTRTSAQGRGCVLR